MVVVGELWEVFDKIGQGSFGEVFAGEDKQTGQKVAIKRESSETTCPQLEHEYQMYQALHGLDGFPKVYYGGQEGQYNVIVMERLGPSLKDLLQLSPTQRLPLQTVIYCVPQILERLEALHSRGIVFRDVKAGQLCVGRYGDDISISPQLFMVDLGLAKYYIDESGRHIRNKKPDWKKSKTGTARYASINVHKGREHTRRDDIESLGYIIVELVKGRLPWSNLRALTSREGWKKTLDIKLDTLLYDLTDGLPDPFRFLIDHARQLGFAEKPDYATLKRMFVDLYQHQWGNEVLTWTVEDGSEWSAGTQEHLDAWCDTGLAYSAG
ncbi:hypothetical protein SpCBS45565_g06460 [Spizellomyces sp. 'palustris']|nr:hypothetical protein SpCBS45565_g06460 [Spizellomyces sp. 'palustris']